MDLDKIQRVRIRKQLQHLLQLCVFMQTENEIYIRMIDHLNPTARISICN